MCKTEYLKPSKSEIVKNRVFGMPTTYLNRHQRVAFTAFIKIAYEQLLKDKEKITFTYPTQDFFKLLGVSKARKQSHLFSAIFVDEKGWEQESEEYALEKTLKELLKKNIIFRKKKEDGKTYEMEGCVLISYFKLNRETITFRFDEWIRENVLVAGNAYIMKMPIIAKLRKSYSVALYEQIEQRRDFGNWEVSVEVLRGLFGLTDDKYKVFSDFRKYCLEKSIDEINNNTDLIITDMEIVRKGRKAEKIIFRWNLDNIKLLIKKIKKTLRENFVNVPIIKISGLYIGGGDEHTIAVSKKGKLYSQTDIEIIIGEDTQKKLWKVIAENRESLLININAFSNEIKVHF